MASEEKRLVHPGVWKASAWFLQNSLDAFVGLHDGKFAWVNDTWCAITGWSQAESTGRPYSDFLFNDDVAAAMAEIDDLPLEGKTVFTHRIAAASGGWLWLQHHAVRGRDGWVLMILRDISAERQREIDNAQARSVSAMVRHTAGVTP